MPVRAVVHEVHDEQAFMASYVSDPDNPNRSTAFLRSNHIDITITGRADVKFDLRLRPSTGADLDDFVDHEIENMDIDLPGWDFITQLCADEGDIRRRVRRGVADLVDGFNDDVIGALVGEIAEQTDFDDTLIRSFLDSRATITPRSIRFPITEERTVGALHLLDTVDRGQSVHRVPADHLWVMRPMSAAASGRGRVRATEGWPTVSALGRVRPAAVLVRRTR